MRKILKLVQSDVKFAHLSSTLFSVQMDWLAIEKTRMCENPFCRAYKRKFSFIFNEKICVLPTQIGILSTCHIGKVYDILQSSSDILSFRFLPHTHTRHTRINSIIAMCAHDGTRLLFCGRRARFTK